MNVIHIIIGRLILLKHEYFLPIFTCRFCIRVLSYEVLFQTLTLSRYHENKCLLHMVTYDLYIYIYIYQLHFCFLTNIGIKLYRTIRAKLQEY